MDNNIKYKRNVIRTTDHCTFKFESLLGHMFFITFDDGCISHGCQDILDDVLYDFNPYT